MDKLTDLKARADNVPLLAEHLRGPEMAAILSDFLAEMVEMAAVDADQANPAAPVTAAS